MSRNKEKAQSNLNQYYLQKDKQLGILDSNPQNRPRNVNKVTSLPQAEKWRSTILSEISVNLTRINDENLTDFEIREINDKLNALFKEKKTWEYHIRNNLKGNDYIKYGRDLINTGVLVDSEDGNKGYRYFGRAKELPDVKVLIEQKRKKRRKDQDGYDEDKAREARLGYAYYGFYDEKKLNVGIPAIDKDVSSDPLLAFESKRGQEILEETGEAPQGRIINFDDIPTNEMVNSWLVNKKRQELLSRLGLSKL
ncbi:Pre-mRNA-splicing factor ISY1 [Candida viswanathii]|uniref:Pre-mRNA-splicing factor ISY1 n=1 Tax=Candida viswanathii TaxID=5486 RepID=A0A367YHT5_9ASCO|nr:Pre-mRNA-splicing factor ISY1 [Candida viswanathii]